MKVIIAIIVAVVLIIVIVVTVHRVEANNHHNQVLAYYDRCLNEPYPDGRDCQTIIHDCANGDSYACHLESVLACVGNSGSGCDNTGSPP